MIKIKNILVLLIIVVVASAFQKEKPKVLIIGDSISIGYTPFVKENLKDIAEVVHNPGNAQHTGIGLENIEKWIGKENWDIIQFNWGLWDLCYRHPDSKEQGQRDKIKGKITYSPEEYRKNLDSIVKLIKKKSKAKLIFVTTSYIPNREAGRFEDDAIKYNEVAKSVMKSNGVEINDIYEESKEIHAKNGLGDDDVHYSSKGYEELGKCITSFLKKEINKM